MVNSYQFTQASTWLKLVNSLSKFWNWLGNCASSVVSDSLPPHVLCNLPGSSVQEILEGSILEWVAVASSRGSSWPRDGTHVSPCFLQWQTDLLPLSHLRSPLSVSRETLVHESTGLSCRYYTLLKINGYKL